MTKTVEPWEALLESHDLFSDLCDLYQPDFYISYASRFDRNPHPVALVQGVHATAKAYVEAKWLKRATKSKLLKYSGVHMVDAGIAAKRLTYALGQISKSDRAAIIIGLRFERQLHDPLLVQRFRTLGPKARLQSLIDTSAALEAGIASFMPLPDDPDDEDEYRFSALEFVAEYNAKTFKKPRKNHPMECAARAFHPVWKEFSTRNFARGRYRYDPPGYDSPAADALQEIVRKLNSSVAPSLGSGPIDFRRAA